MALYEKQIKDGIQLGHALDYCFKCHKPGSTIDKNLEYQEVFKLHVNGLEYCLCMDHFKNILGDYKLVHSDTLTDTNTVSIPKSLIENGTEQEVLDYLKKVTE